MFVFCNWWNPGRLDRQARPWVEEAPEEIFQIKTPGMQVGMEREGFT